MYRYVILLTLTAALAFPASALADHGRNSPERTYQRYAKVRDRLLACSLNRAYNHLGPTRTRQCRRLRRRYTLYSFYGAPSRVFFRCKTSRCPRRPIGVPNPRGRIPADAVRVYG